MDTPLIARYGISANAGDWNILNWPSTTVEWLEDDFLALTVTLDGASIASTGTTATVSDASVLHEGDVLKNVAERLIVTARDVATNVVTIVRGQGGTTAASLADGGTLTVVGNARTEGATNDVGSAEAATSRFNYAQIFQDSAEVSGTLEVIQQYGVENQLERNMMKKMKENLRKLERTLIYGYPQARTASVRGLMGGLSYWLQLSGANTVDGTASLVTQARFDSAMLAAKADGGNPTTAVMSYGHLTTIKNIYGAGTPLTVPRTEKTVGMVIDTVLTPYGQVELLPSWHMPDDLIFLIDSSHFGILPVRPFFEGEINRVGDKTTKDLIGEYTCVVRYPTKAHATIYNLIV
jgi:hypothetical protein